MTTRIADVIILGAGIAGTTLALALRRQGLDVHLIDRHTHPRFATGESTLPTTSFWMKLIAERWKVPELHYIATASSLNEHVSPTSGMKKNVGFVYHRQRRTTPLHSVYIPIQGAATGGYGESHLFRQDVDAYLYHEAIAAGVRGSVDTEIRSIKIHRAWIALTTAQGHTYRARFVADASGYGSVLSKKLKLRKTRPSLRTRSRALFTHMSDVKPFDAFYSSPTRDDRWHNGTLHHFFDGGWLWVIPFDNHPRSKNRLCSVGLNLDLDRHPDQKQRTGADEWTVFLRRFPSIGQQFRDAKAVRGWTVTKRLQYENKQTVGDRYWISPQAGGNVDALYSRGLLHTFQGMAAAIQLILKAFRDNEFTRERLLPLEDQQRNLLRSHDALVYGSYICSRDARLLFDRWIPTWIGYDQLAIMHVFPHLARYADSGKVRHLDFDRAHPERCFVRYEDSMDVLDRCVLIAEAVERGRMSIGQASQKLQEHGATIRDYVIQARETLAQDNATRWQSVRKGLKKMGLENYWQR